MNSTLTQVRFLEELVEISSGTNQIHEVNRVQDLVQARLERMNFTVSRFKNPKGAETSGELLVGLLPGAREETINFIVHADTVFEPSSNFTGFRVSEDGKTARGPGVIDDKGGIVVAITGLERFLARHPRPEYTLRFVCSPNEEVGSPGFKEMMMTFAPDTWMALGFEPALDDGSLIAARKGVRWYQIEVRGREAHAGRAHAFGINAGAELAHKVAQIYSLTDYERDLTVNIGRIEGGQDKFNIVCGHAIAKLDARIPDLEARAELHEKIQQIVSTPFVKSPVDGGTATSELKVMNESIPFVASEQSQAYFQRYSQIVESLEGQAPKIGRSGGSADINKWVREGIILMDGLGPVGGKMHTTDEFVVLSSLETRAESLNLFLSQIQTDAQRATQ